MSLFINKGVKRFIITLILVLFSSVVLLQLITYVNAVKFKNEMLLHDYELAGYMCSKHPEMSSEIQSLFTSDKSAEDLSKGRKLLYEAGYNENVQLNLLPRVDKFYNAGMSYTIGYSVIFSVIILVLICVFMKRQYIIIDKYTDDVNSIMGGDTSIRLDDNEEGSLAKLAAAINTMTSSLHAHIEKEKQGKIFMKDILANISHQLKTPLAALKMYTEIMKDENTGNEVIESFLGKSENELDRMQVLIANLLKMARLDAGIIELNKSEWALNGILKKAAQSFETRIEVERKTIEIRENGEVLYNCDSEWMIEALSNIIKNAVEHTAAGNHITILVDETPLAAKIEISDDGEGIHPEDISHIFKRFYRSRFSQNKQGTGIGLTLSKTIIEMHGGFISVESKLKKGTVFTVNLPKLSEKSLQNCKPQFIS